MDQGIGRRTASAADARGGVRLTVREDGADVLVYSFASLGEATQTYAFIREFFPRADFVFEPLLH